MSVDFLKFAACAFAACAFAACAFPFVIPFKECFKMEILFWSFVAHSSFVFCSSVSADCIVMAASRFFPAAAACVIPLSFSAGSRESYCGGCIKVQVALVICQ